YPSTRESVLNKFESERLLKQDNQGRYLVKRLAVVLFAKKLDEFPDVRRKAPKVVIFEGSDRTKIKLDQLGGRGYAAGYQGLVNYIMAQLPQNEVIEN